MQGADGIVRPRPPSLVVRRPRRGSLPAPGLFFSSAGLYCRRTRAFPLNAFFRAGKLCPSRFRTGFPTPRENQGAIVKKLLLAPVVALMMILLAAGCMSKEDKRDAFMDNARKLEAAGDCVKAGAEARNAIGIDPNYAGAHLLLGRCAMKAEKWADARDAFTRAHELNPADFEALSNLARVCLLVDSADKAAEYADKALAIKPDSVEMKVVKGNVLMRKQEFMAARQVLEEAVKAEPDNEEAVVGLASAYLNTNETSNAKALLKYSLEKKPGSAAMLSLLLNLSFREQDYTGSETYLAKLLALHPDNEHLVIQMADLYPLLGKGKEAPAYLETYLQTYPGAEGARIRLAELLLADGKGDKAMETLDKAPVATPGLHLAKSTLLIRQGKLDDGLNGLRAVSEDPKAGAHGLTALMSLAEIYSRQNKTDDALKALDELIKRSPDNLNAYALRGQINFGLKRFEAAVADFAVVAKGAPDDPSATLALADAWNSAGNRPQAESLIRDVIKRFPQFGPAYVALANFFMADLDPYKALEAVHQGQKALPDDAELAIAEADILIREERYTECIDLLEKLTKRENTKAAALMRLGAVHAAQKEYAKAIKAYDQMLAMDANAMPAVEGRLRMHVAAGELDKALAFAEKRLADRPKDPMAALMAGEAALLNKNAPKAEKAFFQALELAPQWEQPAMRLAQLYVATKRVDQGMAAVKGLMAKNPDAIVPAVLLASLQEEKKDWKAAEQTYRAILVKDPINPLANNNLAFLLSQGEPSPERLAEAESFAAKAAETGDPTTLDTLGWIQHQQGKAADAEAALRKAREGNKESPVIAYHLAAVLAGQNDQGKKAEAKQLLTEALAVKQFPQRKEAEKLINGL